jgi:2,4-dienoyl-CoA reductase-like NADH-dependent reductase (Old Yellow Enzyme family)
MGFDRVATGEDIRRIIEAHARAATHARDVGFDAVEVHFGHGYLVSSFLSPKTNARRDEWGGPLARRAEFARRILAAIRERVGDSLALLAKVNMSDGVRGGIRLEESIPFAQLLESDGHLDAIVLTGGSSPLNPMYLFRGGAPVREFAAAQRPVLGLGIRLIGKRFLKEYPYEPLYFLPYARQFRAALKMPIVLLGGVTDRAGMDTARGSTSSRWRVPCCASPTCPTASGRTPRPGPCASTATDVCRRSTPAPAVR